MTSILPWTIALLETTAERWLRLARDLPEDLLRRPAAPGQWSAMECLHHLVATEDLLLFRLNAFLSGAASFPAYDPDAPENRSDPHAGPLELATEFARRRSLSLEALRGVTAADLPRRTLHAALGPVTLDQLIHEWAAHDLNHTVQAERALMQPFIAGSGPWIPYFADHVMR